MMDEPQTRIQGQIFGDIDDLLNVQSPSHYQAQIKGLKDTIKDFQQICKNLSLRNNELQQKLQQYEQQLQLQQQQKTVSQIQTQLIFNEQYSTLHLDCNDIEQLLKQYRNDLSKYKNKNDEILLIKNELISKLKQQNNQYKQINQNLKNKIYQLETSNQQLQNINNQLLFQIQQMQNNKKKFKLETPKYKNYNNFNRNNNGTMGDYQNNSNYQNQRSYFNDNIQEQLEKLIQKLIKELEYQKNIKKKINQEIKRLQKDIVNLERQIMTKNQKIYSLEIEALKKMKSQTYVPHLKSQLQQRGQRKGEIRTTEEARSSLRDRVESRIYESKRNFSLMQLTNGQIQLNCKQKLTLALKLIKLYEKKIQEQDYTFLILTNISIYNYNPNNLNRMTIKLSKTEDQSQIQDQYEKSQIEIIWNLGFLLDTIFNKTADPEQQFGTYAQQTYLNQFVAQILENRDINNYNTVLQLEKVVKDALRTRN